MTTKMVFHGSDIEKICDYYHLNKEDIVKFVWCVFLHSLWL